MKKTLNLSLWVVQGLLSLTFVGTAIWKLLTPIATLASQIPWAGEVSPSFLHLTAVFDLAGGLGLVLPAATRIRPGLGVLAALGSALLMGAAIPFHVSRGEVAKTPFNAVLLLLCLFVAWGRRGPAPIAPRS